MIIDILCSVVDNLGDIGFVYRLTRALVISSQSFESIVPLEIRLIVDDLNSFASICPEVDSSVSVQQLSCCTVIQWNNPSEEGLYLFQKDTPYIVIEAYSCGRPSWFETFLFDNKNSKPRHIINLEYLTAEGWATEYHLLPSLTQSSKVSKTFFMPGFVQGTGGLLQDEESLALRERSLKFGGSLQIRHEALHSLSSFLGPQVLLEPIKMDSFWVFIFSYEHDFTPIIQDLLSFHSYKPLTLILAAGRSSGPFLHTWRAFGCPFPVLALPSLPQNIWDAFLYSVDFAIVRGEESFAQVALSGKPFVWECYPFSEKDSVNFHLESKRVGHWPKIEAFLTLLSPYMKQELFLLYKNLINGFNGILPLKQGDLLSVLKLLVSNDENVRIQKVFQEFSNSVLKVGNLSFNLLEYIRKLE